MTNQGSVISVLTSQAGKIRLMGGTEIEVKFSFYRYQEADCGIAGRKSAGGCCRVSSNSDVLAKIFEAGLPVMLISENVEAKIRMTSPYSFQALGPVLTRGNCAAHHDEANPTNGRGSVIPMPLYRRTTDGAYRWEREGRGGRVEVVVRQVLSGAARMQRLRPAK
ncbi:hypothetical protein ACFPT7_03035 [Acidicapsa dinghuensis]|uniref:Uncharacterized protein n=1 Tax=Acidicapsa dinghuensis TaxID=2218256 RepID=A0ABW1EBP9_9BACT|nr:hypothetical protein [Acidicapsa dinghuensis]